jgi:hypothetical protein
MAKAIVQSLDGIPEQYKTDYKPIEGGAGFAFDLEGIEEHPRVTALKRAKDREAAEATAAKAALRDTTEALTKIKGEHEALAAEFEERLRGAVGNKADDLKTLDEKWGKKLSDAKEASAANLAKRDAVIHKFLVLDAARAIVAKMGPAEPEYTEVILPHVVRRLTVEYVGDDARTRVLDADGKPSADTVEELAEHFRVDKRFAPLLTGTRARGGSAAGAGQASSAQGKIDLSKATLEEKTAYYKAKQGLT